ncbi:MAG TPA: O-antigen ligase family protein [Candidatus Saccharimonadales bacterium]|nr:O-antigen ligase family protein [Candidatus Saccharimonadales bacterium]
MKKIAPVNQTAKYLSWLSVVILALIPFHAFLTVWASGLVGHYILLRLWKEYLLVIILLGAIYILIKDRALAGRLFSMRLTQLILIYAAIILIWSFVPLARHQVSAKAMWYGLLVDLRFLAFFLSVMVLATKSTVLGRNWLRILLTPAVLVSAFAVLQFLVLPYNFLSHFGYGPNTISPYETINHNINHLRVESFLRGANPLGAYLILPISALGVMFFREKDQRYNKTVFGVGLILALIFSFSRSAWIGAGLSILSLAWLGLRSGRAKRIAVWALAGLVVLGAVAAVVLRNNTEFQNVFLHTQRNSAIATTSNESHVSAAKTAASDIVHNPQGSGVGTAGPESVYNKGPARIAENYFLQIGQEAGIVAMILFIAICAVVGWRLYGLRRDTLALTLLAALIGISFVNLLSHAWTDDTLAYIFWGLTGVALAPLLKRKNT